MKVFDGAKMRAIRKEAEFTQYDLAPMVGISQNRVSDIERNVTTPTNEEIEAFADALNTQVSSFSEVEQPASLFVFRIDKQANMALFEADGKRWVADAVGNVAAYLKEQLADQKHITVLA